MDEDARRDYLRLQTEEERNDYLQTAELWDNFYQYEPHIRDLIVAGDVQVGWSKEMLVMLNKWDGCCIGVPPTPFDAIEVHLTAPVARGPKHAINFGTITGVMKVDPYLIEDWLVGLYILDQSSIAKDL